MSRTRQYVAGLAMTVGSACLLYLGSTIWSAVVALCAVVTLGNLLRSHLDTF